MMHKMILGIFFINCCFFLFTGCATTRVDEDKPLVGKVGLIIEKEILDEKTGEITIQSEKLEEIAERNVTDKGAEALLTPQRFANVEHYFDSYSVGPGNEIIAAIYNQEGNQGSDLWIFRNGKMRLTNTNYLNQFPVFSTDGSRVYFVSTRSKNKQTQYGQTSYIWRMPSNGAGGITRIGTPAYRLSYPIPSPDGSKILFSSQEFYENSEYIWYMQENGALPTQLKKGIHASWIDNDNIVFSEQDENTGYYSIWTLNINGSNLTQIIQDKEMDCISPVVHPSGEYIAYVKQEPSTDATKMHSRDIHIFHFKDGLSQQITTNISRDDLPQWSPDGNFLYFRSSRGVSWNVWRLPTSFLAE